MSNPNQDWKPYLSGLLLLHQEPHTAESVAALTGACRAAIMDASETQGIERAFQDVDPAGGQEGTFFWQVLHYTEKRAPPWYVGAGVTDLLNHMLIVTAREHYVALNFSDNGMRNQIMRRLKSAVDGSFAVHRTMANAEINRCLVENKVRTLWLSGTHRSSAVKADAKTLSGPELESAIDPLGDQTYFYSSIRSTVALTAGVDAAPVVIGTSPAQSRFWIAPSPDWATYLGRSAALLAHVAARHQDGNGAVPILPMLAQVGGTLGDIAAPYDISLLIPEGQFPDAVVDGEQDWLQYFADTVRFDIVTSTPTEPDFVADVWLDNDKLGTVQFTFTQEDDAPIKLKTEVTDWRKGPDAALMKRLCQNQHLLTIYFDTGHTFARGALYSTTFRDPQFDRWQWVDFAATGIDVTAEKPTKTNDKGNTVFAPERIGAADDTSLFGFIARRWPNLDVADQPTGWLICDDGAMESADFIHLDDQGGQRQLTLIHVKGSGSDNPNRKVSVSDYEVVVGQAVKNLRHLDQGILHHKLASYTGDALANTVWHNGKEQPDRTGFLAALGAYGTNYNVNVVIVQPRVRQAHWTQLRTDIQAGVPETSDHRRLKQLDALLQGAAAGCYGLGAALTVVSAAN